MKTIFLDIDGTLLKHFGSQSNQILYNPELLSGSLEKLHEWDKLGYKIILVTGRKESTRNITTQQLEKLGIIYDQLIMGLGRGARVIINDLKPDSEQPTAIAYNLTRNQGVKDLTI